MTWVPFSWPASLFSPRAAPFHGIYYEPNDANRRGYSKIALTMKLTHIPALCGRHGTIMLMSGGISGSNDSPKICKPRSSGMWIDHWSPQATTGLHPLRNWRRSKAAAKTILRQHRQVSSRDARRKQSASAPHYEIC